MAGHSTIAGGQLPAGRRLHWWRIADELEHVSIEAVAAPAGAFLILIGMFLKR
jgi:hypothetical protein